LDKGKIIEKGNHNDLMKKNGEYKNLIQRQIVS
jgi:ABC-type multidrug transport system fused ATPase/permease subunit